MNKAQAELRPYLIYKLTCNISNKSYIGLTCRSLKHRFSQHLSDFKYASEEQCRSRPLFLAFSKYGTECWTKEVIDECIGLSKANELEKFYIILFDTYKNGYNATHGGDGCIGVKWNTEQKLKLSQTLKEYNKNNPREPVTEETKEKQSQIKLDSHWRSETCVVAGITYKSLRQAAKALGETIYTIKQLVESQEKPKTEFEKAKARYEAKLTTKT